MLAIMMPVMSCGVYTRSAGMYVYEYEVYYKCAAKKKRITSFYYTNICLSDHKFRRSLWIII